MAFGNCTRACICRSVRHLAKTTACQCPSLSDNKRTPHHGAARGGGRCGPRAAGQGVASAAAAAAVHHAPPVCAPGSTAEPMPGAASVLLCVCRRCTALSAPSCCRQHTASPGVARLPRGPGHTCHHGAGRHSRRANHAAAHARARGGGAWAPQGSRAAGNLSLWLTPAPAHAGHEPLPGRVTTHR